MPGHITLLYAACIVLSGIILAFAIRDWHSAVNRGLIFFIGSQLGWTLALYFAFLVAIQRPELATELLRAAHGFGILLATSMTSVLYLAHPRSRPVPRGITLLASLGIAALVGSACFSPFIYESIQSVTFDPQLKTWVIRDNFGPGFPLFSGYILLNYALSTYLAFTKLRRASGIDRIHFQILAAGLCSFILLAILVNVILPMFGVFVLQLESPAFSLLFSLGALFAIHRYRLIHLPPNTLQRMTWVLLGLVACIVGVLIYSLLLAILPASESRAAMLIASSLAGLLAGITLQHFLPNLLAQNLGELRAVLQKFSFDLYETTTFAELQLLLEHTFKVRLNIPEVRLFLVGGSKRKLELPVAPKKLLDLLPKQAPVWPVPDRQAKIISRLLGLREPAVLMLLRQSDQPLAVLALGPRASGEAYSQPELTAISSVAPYLTVTITDILIRHKMLNEIAALKKIVELKTRRLAQQNAATAELARQQADFIAIAAHEFRTPLSIALFQIQDLAATSQLGGEAKEDLKVAAEALEKMRSLTQNLFDTYQLDLDKMTLQPELADLARFSRHVFEEMQPQFRAAGREAAFVSTVEPGVETLLDKTRLRQVLHNLLGNALKFTKNGDRIELRLARAEDGFELSVEDSGPGLPPERAKMLFRKFGATQGDRRGGMGLGLYLSHKIIELHGGELSAGRSDLGGARFVIYVPATPDTSRST